MVIALETRLINSSPVLVLCFGPMEEDVNAVTIVQDLHLRDILLNEKQEV